MGAKHEKYIIKFGSKRSGALIYIRSDAIDEVLPSDMI